jgi:hypothetical protein
VGQAELRTTIATIDVGAMFENADPADKAALYADLGLTLTYRPSERVVVADRPPGVHSTCRRADLSICATPSA